MKVLKIVFLLLFSLSVKAQNLAEIQKSVENISIPETKTDSSFRARGDLKRSYWFAEAGKPIPYRIYVPSAYDGNKKLPIMIMLHGGGSDENRYLDRDNRLIIKLAEKHGFILISPLGYTLGGAYGSFLRLPAVFGKPEEQHKQRTAFAKDSARVKTLELSEKDVMNVLEIVSKEYNADKNNIFLAGHSMGSGGTWFLGAKYSHLWRALAPISGPFIDEANFPFEKLKSKPLFVTEGTLALPSLEGSRLLNKYLQDNKFNYQYMEVEANHGDMVALVLPSVFEFFIKHLK